MKASSVFSTLLAGVAALALAGCASTPAAGDAAAPQVASATTVKCKNSEAGTGTSIVRKDCSGNPNVATMDATDLMNSKHTALPNAPGKGQ